MRDGKLLECARGREVPADNHVEFFVVPKLEEVAQVLQSKGHGLAEEEIVSGKALIKAKLVIGKDGTKM